MQHWLTVFITISINLPWIGCAVSPFLADVNTIIPQKERTTRIFVALESSIMAFENSFSVIESEDLSEIFEEDNKDIAYPIELQSDNEEEEEENDLNDQQDLTSAFSKNPNLKYNTKKRKGEDIRKPKDSIVPESTIVTENAMKNTLPPSESHIVYPQCDDSRFTNSTLVVVDVRMTPHAGNECETKESMYGEPIIDGSVSKRKKSLKPVSSASNSGKKSPPDWFSEDTVHHIEIKYFPDYFDKSSTFKMPSTYCSMRNLILNLYLQNPSLYLTATDCRKKLAGDAAAIFRLHEFLDAFKIINFSVKSNLRPLFSMITPSNEAVISALRSMKMPLKHSLSLESDAIESSFFAWTQTYDQYLLSAVSEYDGDWDRIAEAMNSFISKTHNPVHSKVEIESCLTRFLEIQMSKVTHPSPNCAPPSDSNLKLGLSVQDVNSESETSETFIFQQLHSISSVLSNIAVSIGIEKATKISKYISKMFRDDRTGDANSDGFSKSLPLHFGLMNTSISSSISSAVNAAEVKIIKTLSDYLRLRLQAFEEKVKLLRSTQNSLDSEQINTALEKRDLQILKAQVSFTHGPNTSYSS